MRGIQVLRHIAPFGASIFVAVLVAACQATSGVQQNQPSYLSQVSLAQVDVDFSRAERPLLVDDFNAEVSTAVSGGSTLGTIGTRLGLVNEREKQMALEQKIAAVVLPHVEDALKPLFTGTRPVRAVVTVKSVFVRSRMSLQQLTGAHVYVNGKKRPDNAQFVAGLMLFDLTTGMPIQEIAAISRIDDGSITILGGGPKAPEHSNAGRLNKLVFDYARAAANALQNNAASEDFTIAAEEGDKRILWQRSGTF